MPHTEGEMCEDEQLIPLIDSCINFARYESPDEFLAEACRASTQAFGAIASSIRLVKGEWLNIGVAYGYKEPKVREHPIKIDAILSEVVYERKPLIVQDLLSDERVPEGRRRRMRREGFRSCICMPMVIGEKATGILTCYYNAEKKFTEREMRLMLNAAKWIAIAYENHCILRELRNAFERLKAIDQKLLLAEEDQICISGVRGP